MADESKISEYLQLISDAVYGREVRGAIHDAIEQCYKDGSSFTKAEIRTEGENKGHLILTRIDGVTMDCGEAIGPQGDSITKAEVTNGILILTTSGGKRLTAGNVAGDVSQIKFSVQTGASGTEVQVAQTGTNVTLTIPRGKDGAGSVSSVDGVQASSGDVPLSAVRCVAQSLTDAQKAQALTNLGVQNRSKYSLTLTASNWTGTAAPYTYTYTLSPALDISADAVVGIAASVTAEQYAAFCSAQIVASDYSGTSLTLKAFGTKPAVDLPISLMAMPQMFSNAEETPVTDEDEVPVIDESSGGEEIPIG